MKRTMSLGFLLIALGGSLSALEARLGVFAAPPGTLAGDLLVGGGPRWFDDSVKTELGVEGALVAGVPRLLVPLGPSWEIYLDDGWGLGAAVHVLGGYRFGDSPTLVWGGEAEVRTELSWVPGFAWGLTAGIRYVGNQWEFPIRLLFEFPLGPEDKLEHESDRDTEKTEGKS